MFAEGGRLLIAAPDANRRARLRAALSGLDLSEAATVEEALDQVDEQRPDLALAAVLPDGALAGYGMDEDIRRSREAGFAAHLTKPVSLQTLQDAILQAARG